MKRLRDAVAARRDSAESTGHRVAKPIESEPMRRRAFDALHRATADPAIASRARAAASTGGAALAAEREAMSRRLGQVLGLEAPDMAAVAKAVAPAAIKAWVPTLFVSSSMPITTLRTYAAQLERAHGILAFRGMPGGLTKVAPMAKLSAEILRIDARCSGPACAMRDVQLIVDPILFRAAGVARVPALAMLPGDPTQPYCERDDQVTAPPPPRAIVYGDAALSGMLDELARLGAKEEVRDAQTRLGSR